MILLLASLALALDHHVVRPGETITRVANRKSVDEAALRALNGLAPGQEPIVGTVLLLPGTDDGAPAAVVLTLSGAGNATPPGRPRQPLALADELPAGTLVCTEAGGFTTLRLATTRKTRRHDEITLLGGTCLTIDHAWADTRHHAALVSVQQGSVSVRARDEGEGAVTIRTESGVATSDTGGFRVTVEDGTARTEALDGEVSVTGAGQEVALASGFGTRMRKGEAPTRPLQLLAATLVQRPAVGETLRRPDFRWAPVDRALGYRVEFSTSAEFTDIVFTEDVGASTWRPETLFLPFSPSGLWWRVSAFDRTGFLGPPSKPGRFALPGGVAQ